MNGVGLLARVGMFHMAYLVPGFEDIVVATCHVGLWDGALIFQCFDISSIESIRLHRSAKYLGPV